MDILTSLNTSLTEGIPVDMTIAIDLNSIIYLCLGVLVAIMIGYMAGNLLLKLF